MRFSDTYIKYAWENMADEYDCAFKECSKVYMDCLSAHGIIRRNSNGDIMVDINNPYPYIIFTCELAAFFESYALHRLSKESEFVGNVGYNTFLRKALIISESFAAKMGGDTNINAQAFYDRAKEYTQYSNGSAELGFSMPRGIIFDSDQTRYSAIFTDFVASHTAETNRFTNYNQAIEIINSKTIDDKLILDIWIFTGIVTGRIERMVERYTSGKVIGQWLNKGLCPNCGGSFKGLFSKKCSRCGTSK